MWNHEPDYGGDEFEGCDDDYEFWLYCEEQTEMEARRRGHQRRPRPQL